jgi:hypothetical protein
MVLTFVMIAPIELRAEVAADEPIYDVAWSAALGGEGRDELFDAAPALDGGAFMVGAADSPADDAIGMLDAWALRLNADGETVWSRRFGGSADDRFTRVTPLADGGAILLGETSSDDGQVRLHRGGVDAWVVRVDERGDMIWQKSLGGAADDRLTTMVISEEMIVLAGETRSYTQDLTSNQGGADAWVCAIQLDTGRSIWHDSVGGKGDDRFKFLLPADSGWLLVGEWTRTDEGEPRVQPFRFTITSDGKERSRAILAFKYDAWVYDAVARDGGWIIAGKTNAENSDGWIGTLTASGAFSVSYLEGNTDGEIRRIFAFFDGLVVALGQVSTSESRLTGLHGARDAWVIEQSARALQWQQALGGSGADTPLALVRRSDGRFVIAMQTDSIDGDLSLRAEGRVGWLALLDTNGNLIDDQIIAPFSDQEWSMCSVSARSELLLIGRAVIDNGETRAVAVKLTPSQHNSK